MEIYVGNIPPTIKAEQLRCLYQSFGKILFIDIKNRCQPTFAFILFDDAGSASNAAMSMNGYQYQGYQFQGDVYTLAETSLDSEQIDTLVSESYLSCSKKRKHLPETKSKLDDALEKLIAINKDVSAFEIFEDLKNKFKVLNEFV